MKSINDVHVSVVIPVYGCCECLDKLYLRINENLTYNY